MASHGFGIRGPRLVSKYNNRRVQTPDGWFDSQSELRRWGELQLLQKAGEIQNLRRQVPYELIPKLGRLRAIVYIADFVYEDKSGKTVVEDKKGFKSRVYMLKWRLMQWVHNIEILET